MNNISRLVHFGLISATLLMPLSGMLKSVGGGRAVGVFGWEVIPSVGEHEFLESISSIFHEGSVNVIIFYFIY